MFVKTLYVPKLNKTVIQTSSEKGLLKINFKYANDNNTKDILLAKYKNRITNVNSIGYSNMSTLKSDLAELGITFKDIPQLYFSNTNISMSVSNDNLNIILATNNINEISYSKGNDIINIIKDCDYTKHINFLSGFINYSNLDSQMEHDIKDTIDNLINLIKSEIK